MKHYILKILFFLGILICSFCVIDVVASKGLRNCNKNHLETFNAIMNKAIESDFIIIGNSRAACSYNTEVIDSILNTNSYNLGISGQPFGVSNLRYHLYRKNNTPPRELIINIDYAEMNLYTNGYERQQYLPYFGPFSSQAKDSLLNEAVDANNYKWIDKHLPLVRYRGDYKYLALGVLDFLNIYKVSSHTKKGFESQDVSFDGTKFRTVIDAGAPIICQQNNEAFNRLDLVLERCERENVKVYMVYAPIYSPLTNCLDTVSYKSLVDKYFNLIKKYPHTISFLDYSDPNLPICKDSTFFKDANHLNLKGSIEFSKILAKDIAQLRNITGRQDVFGKQVQQ